MELLQNFGQLFVAQIQSPTLGFLMGGGLVAALGSQLKIPNSVYQFIVFVLLMKIGLNAGIEIRESNFSELLVPALFSVVIGVAVVLLGHMFFSATPGVKREDGLATAGLFGAVSASTLAAGMVFLQKESLGFEAWVPALYPFMDIPALLVAIVLANTKKEKDGNSEKTGFFTILKDSLRGSALSALILGLVLGLLTRPESVLDSFYEPLFRGLLSVLMLVMGMEAFTRLADLRHVAHWFGIYAVLAPLVNGLVGFGFGYLAHILTGFSPGGVIMLAIIAASNSDISGPPTLRAGIPSANPSAYIGASTGLGTPVAIAMGIPLFFTLGKIVFALP